VNIFERVTTGNVLWGVGIFLAGVALSITILVVVLVLMPPTHFLGDCAPSLLPTRPRWQQKLAHAGKNVLGVLLIALGGVLALPGVPGQGFLTILIGISLLDLPGKRRFEQRIMRNETIFSAANRIRRRFGKPPFELDPEPVE
jgi:hypothetical protein